MLVNGFIDKLQYEIYLQVYEQNFIVSADLPAIELLHSTESAKHWTLAAHSYKDGRARGGDGRREPRERADTHYSLPVLPQYSVCWPRVVSRAPAQMNAWTLNGREEGTAGFR